jgi:hypothetical protein
MVKTTRMTSQIRPKREQGPNINAMKKAPRTKKSMTEGRTTALAQRGVGGE